MWAPIVESGGVARDRWDRQPVLDPVFVREEFRHGRLDARVSISIIPSFSGGQAAASAARTPGRGPIV